MDAGDNWEQVLAPFLTSLDIAAIHTSGNSDEGKMSEIRKFAILVASLMSAIAVLVVWTLYDIVRPSTNEKVRSTVHVPSVDPAAYLEMNRDTRAVERAKLD